MIYLFTITAFLTIYSLTKKQPALVFENKRVFFAITTLSALYQIYFWAARFLF